jgi:hypothetical protein
VSHRCWCTRHSGGSTQAGGVARRGSVSGRACKGTPSLLDGAISGRRPGDLIRFTADISKAIRQLLRRGVVGRQRRPDRNGGTVLIVFGGCGIERARLRGIDCRLVGAAREQRHDAEGGGNDAWSFMNHRNLSLSRVVPGSWVRPVVGMGWSIAKFEQRLPG